MNCWVNNSIHHNAEINNIQTLAADSLKEQQPRLGAHLAGKAPIPGLHSIVKRRGDTDCTGPTNCHCINTDRQAREEGVLCLQLQASDWTFEQQEDPFQPFH